MRDETCKRLQEEPDYKNFEGMRLIFYDDEFNSKTTDKIEEEYGDKAKKENANTLENLDRYFIYNKPLDMKI